MVAALQPGLAEKITNDIMNAETTDGDGSRGIRHCGWFLRGLGNAQTIPARLR